MKLNFLSLLFAIYCHTIFAQNTDFESNENNQHLMRNRVSRIGLLSIQTQKKVFNFKTLPDFKNSNSLVGINSYGVKLGKNNTTRLIPFSVDLFIDKNELSKTYKYDVSAFGAGFANNINNHLANEVRIDALNFDREQFRENGLPVIVDRFKLFSIKYTGMINILPNIVKLTFSGKVAPLQSTRYTSTPDDIQEILIHKTGDLNVAFPSVEKNATTFKHVMGSGMQFHNDHQASIEFNRGYSFNAVKSAAEAFLGDSEFSIGLMLFNFLDAKLSYAIDGVQTSVAAQNISNGHKGYEIDFLSYKTNLSLDLKLERLVPAKNFFRHFVIFSELTREKSYLSVSDLKEYENVGKDYQTDKTYFLNTTATAGIRFTFLKPYKKINKEQTILGE